MREELWMAVFIEEISGEEFIVWLSCHLIEDVTSLMLFLKPLSLSPTLTEFVCF